MPQLGGAKQVQRLQLPSTANEADEQDRGWVEVRTKLYGDDLLAVGAITSTLEQGMEILTRLIVNWNFTEGSEPDSKTAEITRDNVARLESEDFTYLMNWAAENVIKTDSSITDDQKKTSTDTSVTESTATTPDQTASLTITPPTI